MLGNRRILIRLWKIDLWVFLCALAGAAHLPFHQSGFRPRVSGLPASWG